MKELITGLKKEFTLIAEENHKLPISVGTRKLGHEFPAWTFNGSKPGPTMRVTEVGVGAGVGVGCVNVIVSYVTERGLLRDHTYAIIEPINNSIFLTV
jgi:hypothetical protein